MRSRKSYYRRPSSSLDYYFLIASLLAVVAWSQFKSYKIQAVSENQIDNVCKNTKVTLQQYHNKVCFSLSLETAAPFPTIEHYRLITVEFENNKYFERLNSSSFTDIEGIYPDTSFCIYHHFPDEYKVTTYCEFDIIDQTIFDFKELDLTMDNETNIRVDDSTMFVASDFCVDRNDNVIINTKSEANSRPVLLSDSKAMLLNYQSPETTKTWPVEDWTTVFVTPPNSKPWLSTISSLLPLWKGNVMVDTGVKIRRFLVPQKDQETYDRIVPNYPQFYSDHCYKFGVFPKIQNTKEDEYFEFIYNLTVSYDDYVIKSFRDRMTKSSSSNNLIVVDEYFESDYKDILDLDGFDVKVIDDTMPVHEIADLIHSCKYYICSHLTTAVFSIFLREDSTLIERKIKGAGNLNQAQMLAKHVGCKYIEIGHKSYSITPSLREYYHFDISYEKTNYYKEALNAILNNQ
ncbi:hypothetical protein TVAG_488930 [Trichomonas vaginalis G3]|uniref:Uncharacterized protein n=1 Tax=Trichomonas vaginalis (strain ATCC PRA-98 / G3) TaxID=412133 RepID=A2FL65_TRIV3|nr:hypothetical protein TVAGG3_0426920 [Trichomonas vaginalis G3]EAX94354.1 hypothetical protein TVAG_488930 [Trichomonas vaginalis G3]KAI5536483.1 hypothetical protein TVAGG3_0426920 [Trichomonas vaginalis G3]|eukprot:XP_001307284.1 hypothetical protein [Trichomonas vaginalis G3]